MEEVWRRIDGFNMYEVSNLGRVRSLKYNKIKILKPRIHTGGSHIVALMSDEIGRKEHRVHRLVADAFIPKVADRPFIHHRDGNITNNEASNLFWYGNQDVNTTITVNRLVVE